MQMEPPFHFVQKAVEENHPRMAFSRVHATSVGIVETVVLLTASRTRRRLQAT
jgi:hypothetical protein